ncbi:MAG TPA: glycosyltransferase family 4 protein [Nevskia sp.]|nr:glycosyltransferase family 4 protein [Nevskia sp.]
MATIDHEPREQTRILVITRNLPPLRGGMERLNYHLLRELAAGFGVHVCCPANCLRQLPQNVKASTAPLRPLPGFIAVSALNGLIAARRFRPHLVLAGSGLTAPLAVWVARSCGARSAAYLHGLDIIAAHQAYQRLWVPRFRSLDLVLVNSRHTQKLAIHAGVEARRIQVLHPGVELPEVRAGDRDLFRRRFDLGERPLLLSLGRLTRRKGLVEFLESAMPGLVRRHPELCLVVIGGEAVNALKKGGSGEVERIRATVDRLSLQQHVLLLGEQPDEVVSGAFAATAALIFPVLELAGDVEGFGMVAVEAAAHGVPTVAFAVGGVVDAVAEPDSGFLVRPGDYQGMSERLNGLLDGDGATQSKARCLAFANGFEWPRFGRRLRAVCAEVVEGTGAVPAEAGRAG